MLFISRFIGTSLYGVVDSDDGTEDKISYSAIENIVKKLKIDVKGVTRETTISPTGRLFRIQPYQPEETLTQLQVKTNLIKNCEVTTYNSAVTSIVWRAKSFTQPATIRVSDFGYGVACCALLPNIISPPAEYPLTVVFDDKISYVSPNAFVISGPLKQYLRLSQNKLSLVFDFREVRRGDVVASLYSAVASELGSNSVTIRDDESRMRQELSKWGITVGG